ncbi:MAG: hypothetical protein ACFB0B_10530 [Thermonemataceae bacterium]
MRKVKVNPVAFILAVAFLGLGLTEFYRSTNIRNNYIKVAVDIENITKKQRRKDIRYVYEVNFLTSAGDSISTQVQDNIRYTPPKQYIYYYKKNPYAATFQDGSQSQWTGIGLLVVAFIIFALGIWIERRRIQRKQSRS